MKITDLEIGQFATRNWYTNIKSLYVKRYNLNKYEYWEDGQFSSVASDNSLIFNYNDFKLCDCNGNIIEEFTYPLYMENITNESVADRIVKFVSLTEGTVVIQGNSVTLPGDRSTYWVQHTNSKHWKPYDFSKAPEVEDIDYWDARYNAGLPIYYTNKEGISSIIVAQKPSDYVKYQAKGTYKFYIQDESKTEFTYPMYFECIANHCDKGMIVKFTELEKGYLTKEAAKGYHKIDKSLDSWSRHTNESVWKQVNFDKTICKIIPTQDDIDELISDLKSIIEDSDNRFSPSEYGAGTQLRESGYDQCHDLIDEWMEKYHIIKAPDIDKEDFRYFGDLLDIIMYIENTLQCNELDEPIIGVDYASQPDISFVQNEKAKSRLHNDEIDALSYANPTFRGTITGATEKVVNNLNKTKEFTMNNDLKEAILELINENKQPKVKKPKTPKIVCNVEGTLMEFADEAALKSFMWSSRVESVIRYDLSGKVTVPFELSVEAPKTKASK